MFAMPWTEFYLRMILDLAAGKSRGRARQRELARAIGRNRSDRLWLGDLARHNHVVCGEVHGAIGLVAFAHDVVGIDLGREPVVPRRDVGDVDPLEGERARVLVAPAGGDSF